VRDTKSVGERERVIKILIESHLGKEIDTSLYCRAGFSYLMLLG
jgi:hypothetical protein